MRIWDSTKKLQVVLGTVVTTAQSPIYTSWADADQTTGIAVSLTSGGLTSLTNSTTAVDVVPAPAANFFRQLKFLSLLNADTASITVTLQLNTGGTITILSVYTLAVGYSLVISGDNISVFSPTGALVTAASTGAVTWGSITGTLSSQTDLLAAISAHVLIGV